MHRRRRLLFAVVLCSMLAYGSQADAHQDFAGDVHPVVRERDGQFVVQFRNNRKDKDFEHIVALNGDLVKKRLPIPRLDDSPWTWRVGGEPSVAFELDGRWFVRVNYASQTPDDRRMLIKRGSEATKMGELPTSVEKFTRIEALLTLPDRFLFLAQKAPEGLVFFSVPKDEDGTVSSVRLGEAAEVLFPVLSNPVRLGDDVLVAWIDREGQLQLSSVKSSAEEAPRTFRLGATNANTSLSMHVIGTNLLLAYHAQTTAKAGAQIRMMHCRLPLESSDSCRSL